MILYQLPMRACEIVNFWTKESHDLLFLSQKSKVILDEKQKKELGEISTFNVRARYDNIKRQFHHKADKFIRLNG